MTLNIAIYVFDGVEVLDFAGPFEVFTTATRMHARAAPADPPAFNVFTVGRTRAPVLARAGLKVEPDHALASHPPIDCLVVPGLRVTTHWEDVADLRAAFPALQVIEGPRWCDAGRLVTSAGISAGIDMSLHLVRRLHNAALATRTARQMDFDWVDNGVAV